MMIERNTADGSAPLHRLGFGCSNLGSDLGYRDSCALVDAAFDCGYRHFDVAPPYGHGQAERILGDVLHSVRDELTLVTKVGIAHPRATGGLRAVKGFLGPLKLLMPSLWARGASGVRRASAPAGQFGAGAIRASIEESLTRLRTSRVDWLLLHEVNPENLSPELLGALDHACIGGLLGGLGIGTSVAASCAIQGGHDSLFRMVQVEHFWGAFTPALKASPLLVTHRALRSGMDLLKQPGFRQWLELRGWSGRFGYLLETPAKAADLLVAAALRNPAPSLVLVSSSRPERIRHFADVARSGELDDAAIAFDAACAAFALRCEAVR